MDIRFEISSKNVAFYEVFKLRESAEAFSASKRVEHWLSKPQSPIHFSSKYLKYPMQFRLFQIKGNNWWIYEHNENNRFAIVMTMKTII